MIEPEGRGFRFGSLFLPLAAVGVIALLVVLAVVLFGGGGDADTTGTAPTPTPETGSELDPTQPASALPPYVQTTLGAEYAGDCSSAEAGRDAGKVCSMHRAERQGVHAFILGMTASEPTHWAFVEQRGAQWQVVHATAITADNRGVPGIPWPLRTDAEVVVTGTGSCLNVRTEPGGTAVDCVAEGARITLAAGPQEAQGRHWWRIAGRDGWVAEDFLRYPDATADPEPTPGPPPGPTPAQ